MTIKFPIDPSILWDRTPLNPSFPSSSIVFRFNDVCNYLILTSADIEKLLEICAEESSFDFRASLAHTVDLLEIHKQVLENSPSFGSCRYTLYLGADEDNSLTKITIPLKSVNLHEDFANCSHNQQPNRTVQLSKAIKMSRSFALKNFLRVNAVGKASKISNLLGHDSYTLSGTIKFESLIPEFNIQCVPIRPIPTLSTPLSELLFSFDGSKSNLKSASVPCFGYLTLNQTRKLVFLQEQDPAITIVPTVGVWLRLDVGLSSPRAVHFDAYANDLVYHPLCWAACLRFVQNDSLLKQHIVNNNTFLLVILCQGYIQYFEITPVSSEKTGSYLPILNIQNFSLKFIDFDFTANLNIDKQFNNLRNLPRSSSYFDQSAIIDPGKSIVCRFKVIPQYFLPVNSSLPTHLPSQFSSPQFFRRDLKFEADSENSMRHESQKKVIAAVREHSTTDTGVGPNPRQSIPLPVSSPSKPIIPTGSCNGGEFKQNSDEQHSLSHSSVPGVPPSEPVNHATVENAQLVQVVLDQHQEIKKLKEYIHTLRKIITDLGGDYPDLYVEEIAQLKKEDAEEVSEVSSITKPPVANPPASNTEEERSMNMLELVDNTSDRSVTQTAQSALMVDQVSQVEEEEIEETIMAKYLSNDDIVDIQNYAEFDLKEEELSYGTNDQPTALLSRPKKNFKKSAVTFAALSSLSAASSPIKSPLKSASRNAGNLFSPKKSNVNNPSAALSSYFAAQRTASSLQSAKLLFEMPSVIQESESILKIQSQYL